MRQRARVDGNQAAIVAALRQAGCLVQHLHQVGGGCPDLLVLVRGVLVLVEVKDGSKPPSAQRLTPDEQRWHEEWREASVYILRSVDDVPAMIERVAADWRV